MAKTKKVPELRIKIFTNEWQEKKYSDIAKLRRGLTYKPIDVEVDGIRVLRSSNIDEDTFIQKEDDIFVNEKAININHVKNNDILITSANGSSRLVGKHAIISSICDKAVHGGFMLLATAKHPYFVNASMSSRWYSEFINLYVAGGNGAIGNLSRADLERQNVPIPEESEQIRIGNFFQNLDALIALNQRKHDKLLAVKKSMFEKMFPKEGADVPEIRFNGFTGKWEKVKFGEVVLIQRGGSPRPIEDYITNDPDGINWIKIGDVDTESRYITSTKQRIILAGVKKSRKVFIGDLILSNSMSFGRPYLLKVDGCIHDGWLLIRDNENIFDKEYLLQMLSSNYMHRQYIALAAGGVVNNLNSDLVQSTTVWQPSKQEQKKIGSYFQNLDSLIALQQRELDKLKNIKKACLEKMFV